MENISRETLVAIHETEGIGWKTIAELWGGRKERPIREGMREADLRDCGLKPKVAAALAERLSPVRMEASFERRRKAGIAVITWADETYPRLLKQTADPPAVLYCIGRTEQLGRPAVGVVGTRLATAYGRHMAEELSAAFSHRGVAVISGMARGIDTCAHRGAWNREGGTIAVLGTPVDQIYPPENRQLYRDIAERGLVVSEAPPGTRYHPGMFPSRNRIIAGLSLGVVVVEAPDGSGALITAEDAIEAGRPVFIVPGPLTSPRSRGGLQMLRDGTASVLLDAQDVLSRFEQHLPVTGDAQGQGTSTPSTEALTEREEAVYLLLQDAPRTIDELAEASGLRFGELHALLLNLQIKRKITQQPGSVYGPL